MYIQFSLPVLSYSIKNKKNNLLERNQLCSNPLLNDVFVKNTPFSMSKKISFRGYPVHIVDGHNHATNVAHFAKAIEKNMDIEMHEVDVNKNDKNMKQLKSLEKELVLLNQRNDIHKGDYVAVPALATIPLLNLKDQIKSVSNKSVHLTAETIKANKPIILDFLQKIYNEPNKYKEYVNYLDPREQGIEYTWGVIRELNALQKKGAKVYIPAGHPHDDTLKWMAGQRGLKPELYNYIATGEDSDGSVNKMAKEIKDNNWYNFNLLSLSDANVVTVKEASGAQDYMFAAYDTCITDGARGVYNFSPVRNGEKLIGYSYTDTSTNEYPFEEFPANDEIENIVKFVGQDIDDFLATEAETKLLLKSPKNAPDKLYKIEDIFSEQEIKNRKMKIQGDYVDKSLKLFFRKNKDNKIIFSKCDCEGSGKPSVLSMWGSCFSVFNAIAKDIKLCEKRKLYNDNSEIVELMKKAESDESKKCYDGAEYFYNKILEIMTIKGAEEEEKYSVQEKLSVALLKQSKYDAGKHYLNKLIDNNCSRILKECGLQNRTALKDNVIESLLNKEKSKLFGADYSKFVVSNQNSDSSSKRANLELKIAMYYSIIGALCKIAQEDYPAKVCNWAAEEIAKGSVLGDKIIQRRAEKNTYIGDLYNECY